MKTEKREDHSISAGNSAADANLKRRFILLHVADRK